MYVFCYSLKRLYFTTSKMLFACRLQSTYEAKFVWPLKDDECFNSNWKLVSHNAALWSIARFPLCQTESHRKWYLNGNNALSPACILKEQRNRFIKFYYEFLRLHLQLLSYDAMTCFKLRKKGLLLWLVSFCRTA